MSRNEAIRKLRDGLKCLPPGAARTDAFNSFDQLVVALNAEPNEGFVRDAHQIVVLTLPELRAAADKLLDDWLWKVDGAAPGRYAARRIARSM